MNNASTNNIANLICTTKNTMQIQCEVEQGKFSGLVGTDLLFFSTRDHVEFYLFS